jgi:hypothetical protein
MNIPIPIPSDSFRQWFAAGYPYDRASCGYCISQHDNELTITGCKNPRHKPLRAAATRLVKQIEGLYPTKETDVEKFIRIRTQFARFFRHAGKVK